MYRSIKIPGIDVNLPIPKRLLSVVVGAHRIISDKATHKRHQIKRMVIHELYTPLLRSDIATLRYDIALFELSTSIEFDEKTSPICLDTTEFPDGTSCMVTGWGLTMLGKYFAYRSLNNLLLDENNRLISITC